MTGSTSSLERSTYLDRDGDIEFPSVQKVAEMTREQRHDLERVLGSSSLAEAP
jgi:hypothetical protein